MPVLKNARHEKFAQALANGVTAEKAYVEAGFKPNRHNAAALARREHISTRVRELQEKVAAKAEWSAADRLLALKGIYDASAADDRRTAIAAIAEANKMQGSYPPAQHRLAGPSGGPVATVDLTNASADDLERLEALFGPLAGGSGGDDEGDPSGEGA